MNCFHYYCTATGDVYHTNYIAAKKILFSSRILIFYQLFDYKGVKKHSLINMKQLRNLSTSFIVKDVC